MSYMHGYNYALNHPLFMKLDNDSLHDAIKVYDQVAKTRDNDNAAGIADAIRVILINRAKRVAV